MLSHEIVRAIEQDRQRGVESALARHQLESSQPGPRARARAALLRWLGAVPATSAGCPDAATDGQASTSAATAKAPTVTTRSA